MLLLPYQKRVFESELTAAQAVERLKSATGPLKPFRREEAEHPFEGTVEETTFRIQRISGYRNSFNPELHGRIESGRGNRARVVVAFRPHPLVMVLMAVFFLFLLSFGTSDLFLSAPRPGDPDLRWVPTGMLLFGVVLVLGGFVPEAHKAARLLEEVLKTPNS